MKLNPTTENKLILPSVSDLYITYTFTLRDHTTTVRNNLQCKLMEYRKNIFKTGFYIIIQEWWQRTKFVPYSKRQVQYLLNILKIMAKISSKPFILYNN
jgi:hypothetical protein